MSMHRRRVQPSQWRRSNRRRRAARRDSPRHRRGHRHHVRRDRIQLWEEGQGDRRGRHGRQDAAEGGEEAPPSRQRAAQEQGGQAGQAGGQVVQPSLPGRVLSGGLDSGSTKEVLRVGRAGVRGAVGRESAVGGKVEGNFRREASQEKILIPSCGWVIGLWTRRWQILLYRQKLWWFDTQFFFFSAGQFMFGWSWKHENSCVVSTCSLYIISSLWSVKLPYRTNNTGF